MTTNSDQAGLGRLSAVIRHKLYVGEFDRDDECVVVTIAPYPQAYIEALMGYSDKKCRKEGFRIIGTMDKSGANQRLRIEVLSDF